MAWTDVPDFTVGQVLTSSRMNQMRNNDNIGHRVCTSTTRPASPDAGTMIYETDTSKLLVWDGVAWSDVYPSSPTGSLIAYAGASAPTGWLLCDGTGKSTTTYATLFATLAYTYGGSAGTFYLPDMRGRVPVGAGTGAQNGGSGSGAISGGTALTARTRGAFGGDERLQTHTHTQNSHGHGASVGVSGADDNNHTGNGDFVADSDAGYTGTRSVAVVVTTAVNQNAGSGSSENLSPFVVLNYIIKT